MALIQIKNLTKEYRNEEVVTEVLRGINFTIAKGEFVSIMGPSGSGKSTLMHILGFLDKATDGEYLFEGKNVNELTDDQLAEFRISKAGFVFQSFNLLPRITALDNVALPLVYTDMSVKKRKERAKEVLLQMGLAHRENHFPSQLSGGEKQRVAIARALVNKPEVIFADEPTGNLDSRSGLQVMKILQKLNDEGNTIILVTHEKYTAEHAARIILVKDGNIISDNKVTNRQRAENEKDLKK
jgi:putative ABC transport system ATP-binding protein